MNRYISDKIKVVSLACIILVLYIHAGVPRGDLNNGMLIPIVVREIVTGLFGYNAVPLFYFISGFLFFYGADTIKDVLAKIKRRIKSLLIPYIIGAIHVPLFYLIIETIPGVSGYINAEPFVEVLSRLTAPQILESLFYDSGSGEPWAVHLWFLRDLIIIVALSPILYQIVNKLGLWSIFISLVLFILFPKLYFLFGLFWFLCGHFFLLKIGNLGARKYVLTFVFLIIITATHMLTDELVAWRYIRLIQNASGIIVLWNTYDFIIDKEFCLSNHIKIGQACSFTFFIYIYHDPSFHILVKGIPALMGNVWYGYLIMFVFSPFVFTCFILLFGSCFKRCIPRIYYLLTGGR